MKQYFKDSLRRNAIFLIGSQAIGAFLGFLFWVIAARLYSAENVGLASSLLSAMTLISTISVLGYDIGLVRFLAGTKNRNEMINTCLTMVGMFSFVLAIIFVSGLNIWSPRLNFIWIQWYYPEAFILFTIVTALGLLVGEIFVAMRRTEFQLILNTLPVFNILLIFLMVAFGAIGIFFSSSIITFVTLIIGILFIVKIQPKYRPAPRIKGNIVRKLARFSFTNYIAHNLETFPSTIMPLLILTILSPAASAYFSISYSIASVLAIVPNSVGASLFAEGSYQPEKLRGYVIRATKLLTVFLIPTTLIVFFLGDKILSIFGAGYARNSIWMLRFLALSWLPAGINIIYINICRVQMKIKPLLFLYATAAIITIAVSCILMKMIGLIGIGIAWLGAQGITAFAVSVILLKTGFLQNQS